MKKAKSVFKFTPALAQALAELKKRNQRKRPAVPRAYLPNPHIEKL